MTAEVCVGNAAESCARRAGNATWVGAGTASLARFVELSVTTLDPEFDSRLSVERTARRLIDKCGAADALRIARQRADADAGGNPDVWHDIAAEIERISSPPAA